jgi:acyl dehydratase
MNPQTATGLHFEDLTIGRAWRTPARTITEADIVRWAGLSGDYNLLHTDEEFARSTQFGRRIFHGPGVFAIGSGLAWTRLGINEGTALAFLGVRDWTMRTPVFAGDTIHVIQTVGEKRESSSTPDRGIVTFDVQIRNQADALCQEGRWVLLWRRR